MIESGEHSVVQGVVAQVVGTVESHSAVSNTTQVTVTGLNGSLRRSIFSA